MSVSTACEQFRRISANEAISLKKKAQRFKIWWQSPVPKFIKELGSSVHIVQNASYEKKKWISSPERSHKNSKFPNWVGCFIACWLWPVKGRPNSIQMSLILRWRSPNPYKVCSFSDFWKPSTLLKSNDRTSNLVNWLILMWSFLWWTPISDKMKIYKLVPSIHLNFGTGN